MAFIIAVYIIITGPPTLDDVQKAHEEILKSEGYQSQIVTDDAPSMETTLYDLLGVDRDADMDEITSSYLSMAKAAHPNNPQQNNNNSLGQKAFIHLAEAYKTLSDEQQRMEYDHDLVDGTIEKKAENKPMSMDEAQLLFEDVLKQSIKPTVDKIIARFRSCIGNLRSEQENHEESQVGIPHFPMVGQIMKMLGGPKVRVFKIKRTRRRRRFRISKMCVNGVCRITVAQEIEREPSQD